jgi:hypothetical protein
MSCKPADPETCEHLDDDLLVIDELPDLGCAIKWCRKCGALYTKSPAMEEFSYPDENWRRYL